MPVLSIHDLDYACTVEGSGPALLLLHGFTGSRLNWQPLIQALAPEHRMIAPDLLGHGKTAHPGDPQRHSMPQAAADLAQIISTLGENRIDLLGYSMGGRLALYFALHYPHLVHRLVLESASPGLKSEAERLARRQSDEELAQRIERDGIPAFVDAWERLPLFASQTRLPEETRRHLRQQRMGSTASGLANSLRGMGTGAQPSLWESLHELNQPVLLIVGELDEKFTRINQLMAASLPNAEIQIIPDAGHTVHLEQPGDYLQQVSRFFAVR